MGSIGGLDDGLVFPCEDVAGRTIKPSLTDAYSPKIWAKQTLLWRLEDPRHFNNIYDTFKQGLSRMLVDIPELTGTTGRGSEDARHLVILIPQNGHVEFTQGDLSSDNFFPDYESWAAEGWPMTKFYDALAPLGTKTQISDGEAFFKARLTRLKGGIALSFAMNHLLIDGASITEMERIWSEHTADVCAGIAFKRRRIDTADDETRKRLSTAVPDSGEFKDDGWAVFPTEKSQVNLPRSLASKETALGFVETAKKEHIERVKVEPEKVKWVVWYFSGDGLAQLKKDATVEGAPWISTIDALCGLFWARTQHHLNASQHGHEASTALFPINIRQRLQPPIDPHYIGNAVDIVFLNCALAALEAEGMAGVQAAAQRIRTIISGWSQKKWEAWLSMAVNLPSSEAICPNPLCLLSTHNIGFNDFSKMGSNTRDWGVGIGRPDRVRYMAPPDMFANCAPTVRIHPRLADGGLEVAITRNEQSHAAMENDEVMLRYGRPLMVYD